MNNLITESFERVQGRYPGEGEIESGRFSLDVGMGGFFKQVGDIEKQIETITAYFAKLQSTNSESQLVTKASEMKAIRQRMDRDVEDVKMIALKIKTMIEQLDKDNMSSRSRPGCEKGTAVDRSRTGMTVALKKKLKEKMTQFQNLRQNIHNEYREVVERRVYTVTGKRPDEETVDQMIETGHSEQIFQQAIQNCGRGQVETTVAEIQERHDAVLGLEKKLMDLHQMFLDMSVLVESQGDMLDDIEAQVTKSVDHVLKATASLHEAKQLKKSTRKYMCIAIVVLIIVVLISLGGILKGVTKSF